MPVKNNIQHVCSQDNPSNAGVNTWEREEDIYKIKKSEIAHFYFDNKRINSFSHLILLREVH